MSKPILWTSTRTSGSIALQAAMVAVLDIETRFISLRAGDGKKPEYLAINPKGQVPALQLPDGQVITEIPAIMFWLAEAAPASGLLPADATGKAKGLEWLAWCHWNMARAFNMAFGAKSMANGDEAIASLIRDAAIARVTEALTLAEAAVAKAGGTLLGTAQPSAPDIFLAGLTTFAGFLKVDASGFTALNALVAKVNAMPGIAAAAALETAQG